MSLNGARLVPGVLVMHGHRQARLWMLALAQRHTQRRQPTELAFIAGPESHSRSGSQAVRRPLQQYFDLGRA